MIKLKTMALVTRIDIKITTWQTIEIPNGIPLETIKRLVSEKKVMDLWESEEDINFYNHTNGEEYDYDSVEYYNGSKQLNQI